MLDGLVAMGIIAHVHDLHLTDLMDYQMVITVVEDRWDEEH